MLKANREQLLERSILVHKVGNLNLLLGVSERNLNRY
jgi:hypothetical protein